MEHVTLREWPLPSRYKERIFGVSEDADFWNPHGQDESTIANRPFCEWDEYKDMMIESWRKDDYRTLYIVAQLAIVDEQWKQLSKDST
ncbi:hypothetical protein M199_gp217 [Halogranum tailed virus 1]|uniref:Uncharacterized protein n=1 Tax=Halogranum tailed virus 1 TaxID=1273749 RepID=R4T6X6_9CAUD|nr:hypothetical protein M199_gp217 [Halogranum tailed virus 1]AGM11449.1 hypothetical protein HGTV1_152 [Halogranum tailed virus 1]